MPLVPRSSYYDKHYRMSPALIRARKPYLIKNALTGMAICAFTISVYVFTIRAIGQDDFEDVTIPNAPAQPAHTPNTSPVRSAADTSIRSSQS